MNPPAIAPSTLSGAGKVKSLLAPRHLACLLALVAAIILPGGAGAFAATSDGSEANRQQPIVRVQPAEADGGFDTTTVAASLIAGLAGLGGGLVGYRSARRTSDDEDQRRRSDRQLDAIGTFLGHGARVANELQPFLLARATPENLAALGRQLNELSAASWRIEDPRLRASAATFFERVTAVLRSGGDGGGTRAAALCALEAYDDVRRCAQRLRPEIESGVVSPPRAALPPPPADGPPPPPRIDPRHPSPGGGGSSDRLPAA